MEQEEAVLAPTVFMVTYTLCKDVEIHKVTIDYYYKGTTKRVVFDNDEANPWTKNGLENDYYEKVTSPTKANCTPDNSSVNVSIEGKDFYKIRIPKKFKLCKVLLG